MRSSSNKICFVIQRFDKGRYDKLFEQIFQPAITAAGFEAYRVDLDPGASIPIETIERKLVEADVCFAEISEDAPNIWYELGFASAQAKPLCLVCSDARTKFPFDIQHRQVIQYPDQSVPTDFTQLTDRITDRLKALSQNEVSLRQNAEVAKSLDSTPTTSGLRPHEVLALTITYESQFDGGIVPYRFSAAMERAGFTTVAAGLAIAGLRRKDLVQESDTIDHDGDPITLLKVTPEGENWLMDHQDELKLSI